MEAIEKTVKNSIGPQKESVDMLLPGSPEARAAGCLCPPKKQGARGVLWPGNLSTAQYYTYFRCPLHVSWLEQILAIRKPRKH